MVTPAPTGFVVMPKRWVVERTHAWNERARRLIMHHDRLFAVSEAWVSLAEARILARRLTTFCLPHLGAGRGQPRLATRHRGLASYY
jgi:hypothetical protein